MPYLNIPESVLSSSISRLIGGLRANFKSNVNTNLETLGDSFKNGCPDQQQLNNLLSNLNNTKQISINVTDRLNRFRKITPPLKNTSRAILRIVRTLKLIPFPPFFPGGKIADLLLLVKEIGTQLKNTAESIEFSIEQAGDLQELLKKTANIAEKIDIALEVCELGKETNNLLPPSLLNNLVNGSNTEASNALTALNNIIGRGTTSPSTTSIPTESTETYTGPDGKEYTIKIIQVDSNFTRAPSNQAIALDSNNVIQFQSSKSFSSSIEVLKREVKFIIDNSQV